MTRWTRAMFELTLVVCWLGTSLALPASGQDLAAQVRLRGAILADTTVGGADETLAEWSDSNSVSDSVHTRESGGELSSNTSLGRMEGAIYSQTDVPGSFLRSSAFVQMFLKQIDTFTIGAGTSGLSSGDPVQVRIQAVANTTLVLEGNPSGGSQLLFNVEGVPGVAGRWVDWQVASIYPPQVLEFNESWEIVADTTVGASFTLTTNLEAQIGTNSAQGPMEKPERSDATGLAIVRVSAESEGIDITSMAGAPTTPLPPPPVPALSAIALMALVAGLGGVALLQVWRSRRVRLQRSDMGSR